MMRLLSTSLIAMLAAASPLAAQEPSPDIFNEPRLEQLDGKNVNPYEALVEAMRTAAIAPPKFVAAPGEVILKGETGENMAQTVRITNTGGSPGKIFGINALGAFEGLSLGENCPDVLENGKSCDLNIRYSSGTPSTIQSVIAFAVEGKPNTTLEVPIRIEVRAPVVVEPAEPELPPVVVPQPIVAPEPAKLSNEDIARQYFGAFGGMQGGSTASAEEIIVISAPKPASSQEVAGVPYRDIRVETLTNQSRYGAEIPSTSASLPVDRDRILTSDRVIKAILETPVSSVMCGKTVALVESDVYSATSRVALIQAGSRIVGKCQDFADERVGIVWERILTTDGRSITFENEGAATRDASGLGGALGRVYRSKFDRYALPIASTMIDAAAGVAAAVYGENEKVITDANGNLVQETSAKNEGLMIITGEARGTAQNMINDIRDVREVMIVPKGTRIDVEIGEDIYFREDRKVVRLADMEYEVEAPKPGPVSMDAPGSLKLVPVDRAYDGPAIDLEGRRYRVQAEYAPILDENGNEVKPQNGAPSAADLTLDELNLEDEAQP